MAESSPASEISAFYDGRSVLVTGGTGFMGKVLLEKLLYACDHLRSVFVLVRPKRGRSPSERRDDIVQLPVFQRVRSECPERLEKLVFLHGDVQEEDLGLSQEDLAVVRREVSAVFHCAATLRLEAKLKDSIRMNLLGTWNVLQLCKTLKKLEVLVHLSTAFCYCDLEELGEKMYPCPYDPRDILRAARWMDDSMLDAITAQLIHPHPNTYTFTKRLAEVLVEQHLHELPVVIARPSIVTPSWKEPVAGWVDSLNGPVGLLAAAGKGVLRSMYCRGELHAEVMSVDFAINGLITLAAREAARRAKEGSPSEVPVYNITSSKVKRMTWKEVLDYGRQIVYEYPFEWTVWYPDGNIRSSKLVHKICVIVQHYLPAYFLDFLFLIFGQRRFMVRLQRRISDGLELLQYFTTREWNFRNERFLALYTGLNAEDKRRFDMDMVPIEPYEYLVTASLGARLYCFHEDPASLPRCRRNIRILYVLDRTAKALFVMLLLWLLVGYSETARSAMDTVAEALRSLPLVGSVLTKESTLQPI
ncbi:putative fatty acyl-CoA reductase CG5065 isoform X2 [Schistocerca serialis cubense]|uniref:putative fatty acyl-CoA reductase CG5065 isoform X1 n=1 Tax=Schistocerca serialis cubense TaxID=2023355 RepID=UPI00214E08CD|nr:putative fatty acyl-CoA reductase CG5065 isoform X1 [Schistocerca serialis cubense]XP_049960648.1 putative fatty acyl-CoA reductase CG5065 isoform X2 [Schistocerca serialis cubense]